MGSTFAVGKLGFADAPPLILAGLRFVLAGGSMVIILHVTHRPLPRGRVAWLKIALVGLLLTAGTTGPAFLSLRTISAGESALLLFTNPLLVVILARLFFGVRYRGRQWAGVVVGLGGIAGHVLRGLPGDHPGYNSMAIQTRDCSVVTGACMMTRRDVFDSVGGFDEHLPVAFNDVYYCLSLRERGFLVVYTPLAELVHHESRSRGHTDDLAESRRILERWGDVIVAGDPYLNANLSHWRYWCPLSTAQEDDRWETYLEKAVSTRVRSSST
jgi:hypothetical protein